MHDFHSHFDLCDRPLDVYIETVKQQSADQARKTFWLKGTRN